MRLDVYLAEYGFAKSRTHAKNLIILGKVFVNGMPGSKPGDEVKDGDEIYVDRTDDYSSLGGIKLKHALECFGIDVNGKVCIDIGASNGGFTDVMLKGGAQKVFCVDIGECALSEEIKSDSRTVVLDRLNARYIQFEDIGIKADLITADVSFISLKLIIPALIQFLPPEGKLVVLVKPQFEVGKKFLTKSGIVKNQRIAEKAVEEVSAFAAGLGLKTVGTVRAPHPFKDKNVEYLTLFVLNDPE